MGWCEQCRWASANPVCIRRNCTRAELLQCAEMGRIACLVQISGLCAAATRLSETRESDRRGAGQRFILRAYAGRKAAPSHKAPIGACVATAHCYGVAERLAGQ